MGNMDELPETVKILAKAAAEIGKAMSEVAHAIREAADEVARDAQTAREEFARALESYNQQKIQEALESLADMGVDPEEIPRKPERPRPPKFAGPQNKGRAWTRQPQRLARSCCRKCRR